MALLAQWHPGTNTALGTDYTLFSHIEGIVIFDKKRDRSLVCGRRSPSCKECTVADSKNFVVREFYVRLGSKKGLSVLGTRGCLSQGERNASRS
jgi:hypothetical protein